MDPSLVVSAQPVASSSSGPAPLFGPERGIAAHVMVYLFVIVDRKSVV